MEGRDFIAIELGAHLIDFFSPDAMFPTDAAANFNAEFEGSSRPTLPRGDSHWVRWHRKGLTGACCHLRHERRWQHVNHIAAINGQCLPVRQAGRDAGCAIDAVVIREIRPTAGNAFLRPAQKRTRSASSCARRTSVAPAFTRCR